MSLLLSVVAMVAVLILLANQLNINDSVFWQQLLWWQRAGNIVALCRQGL